MTDIVPSEVTPLEVISQKMPAFLDLLQETGEDASNAIMERTLGAGSIEEAFAAQDAVGGRELLGRPLILRGMHLQESDYAESVGFYAVLDVVDEKTGEKLTVTTGSKRCLAQLYVWFAGGMPQIKIRFMEPDKPTKRGFKPLRLELVD